MPASRVKTVIHQTKYYDLRVSQRYYPSDCFYATELLKVSPGSALLDQIFNEMVTAKENARSIQMTPR